MKASAKTLAYLALGALVWLAGILGVRAAEELLAWPIVTIQAKPHAYWWWMASTVDTNNIAKELARYRDAGMGGVHIIPIYGAKGWESNYISYLSPKWMEMLDFTVTEAKRLGLEVDMTTGSGWCFGGPKVTDEEANANMLSRQWTVASGEKLTAKVDRIKTQALMAFGSEGRKVDLLGKISTDGAVDWTAPEGEWMAYAISQKPSGQKVKRAAPGGEGWMLNLAYPQAMTNYLRWMDEAFANYQGAKPRAQYHDSYEYKTDWSPDFFAQFEKRRGYRLQDELDVFLTGQPADRAARVKCDYRETLSDIMVEETLPMWTQWAHGHGSITRNEAHGSPGNWLDLYAAADIPETEMFHQDRSILISKFTSSAAHVTGKPLVAAESGTWLAEHFTETLADMKYLLDDLFVSGVNHVFYHGTCYSPDEAPWPGWVFYASYEMNPRNAIWHDVAALNAYVTRCQSVLQSGQPDNDLLLYWPIHDFWSNADGTTQKMSVHARNWFEEQPVGRTAEQLWKAGYQFDYVSDRQLAAAKPGKSGILVNGQSYRAVVVPACERMPAETFAKLTQLAESGVPVLFDGQLPEGVPGLGRLDKRQAALTKAKAALTSAAKNRKPFIGNLFESLNELRILRERMFDHPGLMCVRRKSDGEGTYFIANRGNEPVDGWIPVARGIGSGVILDPLTGETDWASVRETTTGTREVLLKIAPGGSVILRCFWKDVAKGGKTIRQDPVGAPLQVGGEWQVKFLSGGPELPAPFATERLASWTRLGDTNALSFAGTAVYSLKFDVTGDRLKAGLHTHQLDLGKVCQSARVRLNGKDYGTLFVPPFRVVVDNLKTKDNVLEVEVTSTSANRIRNLDRRGVKWQNFHDINFVNLNYQKFDASNWPVAESGLLGPVSLTKVRTEAPIDGKTAP